MIAGRKGRGDHGQVGNAVLHVHRHSPQGVDEGDGMGARRLDRRATAAMSVTLGVSFTITEGRWRSGPVP